MSVRPSGKFFDRKHGSNRVTRPLFLVILCTIGMLLFSVLLFTRNFGLFFTPSSVQNLPHTTFPHATTLESLSSINEPTVFDGQAMPRDLLVNGKPSRKSDSLVISMTEAVAPRAGTSLKAYLWDETDAGTTCEPLPVSGGVVDITCEFPGQNLVASYSTVRIMQESDILNTTLPTAPLTELRKILAQAEDTPNSIGYGPGLLKQSEVMALHAGFAVDAFNAGNLSGGKVHIEHVLNILYGSADARYGDQNDDGRAENPGDGYGVLRYSSSISQTMQSLIGTSGATANMLTRAAEVQTSLQNIGTSTEGGLWASILIDMATQVLAATTAEEALTPAQNVRTDAILIRDGQEFNDNGTIEPIENEGGAKTAYLHAQYAADYLATDGAIVRHQDSATNMYSNQLQIQVPSMPSAPTSDLVHVYMLGDDDKWRLVGTGTHEGTSIDTTVTIATQNLAGQAEENIAGQNGTWRLVGTGTHGSADSHDHANIETTVMAAEENLAGQYRGVKITVGKLYAEDMLPAEPLGPLRQALAQATDTPSNKGYSVGLVEQAEILALHAGFALDAVTANNLSGAKGHTEHALNILYGSADEDYGDQNGDGQVANPGDGFGILRYSSSVSQTMQLMEGSAGATTNMVTRANEVKTTLGNIGFPGGSGAWAPLLIGFANEILAATTAADALTPAQNMKAYATLIRDGQEFNDNGDIEPIANEGGAQTAYLYAQKAADYTLELLVTPDATATPVPPTATNTPSNNPTATATTNASTPTAVPTDRPNSGVGDGYENDDSCADAGLIASNGIVQKRTFHKVSDADWARFDAEEGTNYLIEIQIPAESNANVSLELLVACGTLPDATQDHAFSPGVRLQFEATATGPVFLKMSENNPDNFGNDVSYNLSVRALTSSTGETQPGALIVVAGRLTTSDPLQDNINNAAQAFYDLYQEQGYDDDRITYLNTDLSISGVDAKPTKDRLRDAITNWAVDKVDSSRPLTIYMIDHGDEDRLYLDKPLGEQGLLSPSDLNDWLNQLEDARPGVKINVIIEMCYAGSFIDGTNSISKANRLIVASTSSNRLAYASEDGAVFTDHLIPALKQRSSVLNSFQTAAWAASQFQPLQEAWLDGNGNGIPNEPGDENVAAQRGFSFAGSFPDDDWVPYVQSVAAPQIVNGQAVIRATVLDDLKVERVWAVIYPPSYRPVTDGDAMIREVLPTIVLQSQGNNEYAATYPGFNEPGTYRIVIHSEDNSDLTGRAFTLEVQNGSRILLPFVMQ